MSCSLPPQTLPQSCVSWLKSFLMQVCKPYHYALVEAAEPFKLHPMLMSCIYERFEHLLRLWMGIWLHNHIVTTTDTSPELWELAGILPDASVQTLPLCFGWSYRIFKTTSHVHIIYIRCLSLFSGCGWAYGFTLTPFIAQTFPQIWESWLKSYLMQLCKPCHYALVDASVETMLVRFGWGCRSVNQRTKKPCGIYDTLRSDSKEKKSSTMVRPPYITSTHFTSKTVDVLLAASLFCTPKLHLLVLSRCKFCGMIIFPPKITSTYFLRKMSWCYFGGKRYCECLLILTLVYIWNEIS